jgi:hypothetical protein
MQACLKFSIPTNKKKRKRCCRIRSENTRFQITNPAEAPRRAAVKKDSFPKGCQYKCAVPAAVEQKPEMTAVKKQNLIVPAVIKEQSDMFQNDHIKRIITHPEYMLFKPYFDRFTVILLF